MDFHTALRCRSVTRDLACCPDRGNKLQSTVPPICHTILSVSADGGAGKDWKQVFPPALLLLSALAGLDCCYSNSGRFSKKLQCIQGCFTQPNWKSSFQFPPASDKSSKPKSTGFTRAEGKADAAVLPVLENFRIKELMLVQLHSEESPEDPSAPCWWHSTGH